MTGAHAVVTLDGAGWHQPGGKLRIPDNISLLRRLERPHRPTKRQGRANQPLEAMT